MTKNTFKTVAQRLKRLEDAVFGERRLQKKKHTTSYAGVRAVCDFSFQKIFLRLSELWRMSGAL
jgi:hypothetical protein